MTGPSMKSSLYLRSGLKTNSLTVTPIIYLSNGVRYSLPPVNLDPAGTAIIDIGQGLQAQGIASYANLYGYLEIDYPWPWAVICATIKNVDALNSLVFTSNLQQPPVPSAAGQQATGSTNPTLQSFEGLWWKQESNVSGFLALANVGSQSVNASIKVTDANDSVLGSYQVTISPQGTKMVDLNEIKFATGTTGGVYVTHDGPAHSVAINAALSDNAVGYSAHLPVLQVPDPPTAGAQPAAANMTLSALGLMTGLADPMMSFPAPALTQLTSASGRPPSIGL
jgi:hypothetical protein